MTIINKSQLKSHISQVIQKVPKAKIIGFKTKNFFSENIFLDIDNNKFLVHQCISELSIRESIIQARQNKCILVIMTNLNDQDISDDIIAIMAKRKLIPVRPWAAIKELFKAKMIDNTIINKHWLADKLFEFIPKQGYELTINGFLSAERIWSEVLPKIIGLNNSKPDIKDILKWSLNEKNIELFRQLSKEEQKDIIDWINFTSGLLCSDLLKCVINDQYFNLCAIGLAYEIISNNSKKNISALHDASIRLEKYTQNTKISSDNAIQLSSAARELFFSLTHTENNEITKVVREKFEFLLKEINIIDYAYFSTVSLIGFEQLIEQFADELHNLLKKRKMPDFSNLENLLNIINKHQVSEKSKDRINQLQMSFRLVKWLHSIKEKEFLDNTFDKAASRYAQDGGYIDWARRVISFGDSCQNLSKTFSIILEKVSRIREEQNKKFAELLVKWSDSGSPDNKLLLIENILSNILAKAAKKEKVLFIVIDGINHAVFSELKNDLLINDSWIEVDLEDNSFQKPVIAAFPTVTDVCRRSLLSGKLTCKQGDDEAKLFSCNKELVNASGVLPPIIFHKADILSKDGTGLSDSLNAEIISSKRKIVGVIVNAVDNFLFKNDQMRVFWKVETIPILSNLLRAAKNENRTVIIIGDHGHVFDYQTKQLKYNSGGERWRVNDDAPKEGEITIKGSRVLKTDDNTIIAPWSERIRYSTKKNGYHGGLTPQEVVIPLCALKWEKADKGFNEVPYYQPEWWDCTNLKTFGLIEKPTIRSKKSSKDLKNKNLNLLSDFEKNIDPKKTIIDKILESDVMINQKKLCGRAVLTDDKIRKFLEVLYNHGGTIIKPALSTALSQPLLRIGGVVSVMQKILNVDGYDVLSYDSGSQTINLNDKLLKSQFNIEKY